MKVNCTELLGDHVFYWKNSGTMGYLELNDRSRTEAIRIAVSHGYRPLCWYRPSTWKSEHRQYYCSKQ